MKKLTKLFLALAVVGVPLLAQDGKALYEEKCVSCHGKDGAGKTAMGRKQKIADVSATAKSMTAAQMEKIVTDGKGNMDAYGKEMKPEQIKAVVAYYRGLAK